MMTVRVTRAKLPVIRVIILMAYYDRSSLLSNAARRAARQRIARGPARRAGESAVAESRRRPRARPRVTHLASR